MLQMDSHNYLLILIYYISGVCPDMNCVSGKKSYPDEIIAEEALIGAHIQFDYGKGSGPVNFYRCEDCGNYHLTSQGQMNERLAQLLKDGQIYKMKEASRWEGKLRRRS